MAEASSFFTNWLGRDGRFRSAVRLAAAGTAAAVAVTIGVAAQPEQAVAAPRPAAQKAKPVASRPDLASAQVSARAQGSRVEVESLLDETSTTWVNPDGTLTTQQHQGPIRFRDPATKDAANPRGEWRDVDLTMTELADGTVAPKGHILGLSLAGAGKAAGGAAKGTSETDLAVVAEKPGKDKASRQVTVGFGGKLGKPQLDGPKATYKDVAPGIDVVVEARRTGYETLLVIKDASALERLKEQSKTNGPISWDIPLKTKGLTARAEKDRSVSFVAKDGTVASHLPAPIAWDAKVDERSGNRVNESPVAVTVTQKGSGKAVLTLTPDQDWLSDPSRVFPVTIDPTYATGANTATSIDAYVSSAYPTANYASSTELRVGTYNGGGDKYRSFLKFGFSNFKNLDVTSATLSLYEFHSWSCTAKPFYVYSSGATDSTVTWNTQPGVGSQYGSLTVAKGYSSSCAAGRVSVPITGLVDWWSTNAYTTGWLRLHASETDNYAWKKFYSVESSQDPYITFTYNRKPNAAAAPTMETAYTKSYLDPRDSKTYLFTTDSTPRFYSKATDPDGSTVSVTFEVHSSTAGTADSKVSSCATGYGGSGASVYCSPTTALANNTYYYARAAVKDDRGLWNGTWSAWTKFGTAYNNPPAATVSCPGYANGAWTDAAPTSDVVCTIKATGITGDWSTPGYVDLTVDGVVQSRRKITPTNDPSVVATTVTIPKSSNGAHTIVATSVARTEKLGTPTTYSFGWGGASLSMPTAGTASSGKVSIAAGGPPRGTSASVAGKIQWRVAGSGNESTGWTDGPAVTVTNNAGGAPSSTDPVKVNSSFLLSSVVREAGALVDLNSRIPVLLDVQVCFAYAGVATPQCTWSQTQRSVTRIPHAFGNGYPTADAGPGQVALFTGEFNTSATDVTVPGYSGDLALSRSHTSFDGDGTVAGWPSDPVTGVFGPGWTASLEGPEAGAAGLQVIDNTRQDGTIVLVDEQGDPLVFQTPTKNRAYKVTATGSATAPYLPATTDTKGAAADLVITSSTAAAGASMVMTLTEEDGTVTTWAPIAYSSTVDTDWVPVSVNEPGQVGSTTYGHDATGRVTRIVAAVPPNGPDPTTAVAAVTCPTSGTLVKGCRALNITYASSTTATSTAPGDYTGRVKQVTSTLWDPAASGGAGAMATTTVATYTYDTSGRLVNVTDPRTALGTDYTWDGSSTRLTSIRATGLAAYRLTYDSTPNTPRVAAVTRDNPAGSGSPVTLARYNYAVPISGSGLPDLTSDAASDQVRLWNQASSPVFGYAVFGSDYTGAISGTGVDWSRADLQYADDQGYTVNTASYGAGAWQVTATDYDAKGNTIRELDAGATKIVRDAATAGDALDAGEVDALSAQTMYNADIKDSSGKVVTEAGTLVTDTYGPSRNAWVNADLNDDGVPGDVGPVRPHTKTVYDQGAPNVVNGVGINPANGEPYRLPTTIATGVARSDATPGDPDLETTSTTVNKYAKLSSGDATEGDPWKLGTPTQVTTGGITQTTRYDAEGRSTETRQPLSNGTDAGTTRTIYYTAYANGADSVCGNKVEWAGLVCRTLPAANPTAGASGAGTLPDSRTSAYNAQLQPLTVVETSGAVSRTTQTRYDAAGRTTATWTDVTGLSGSTPRPGTFTHYRTADGLVDYRGKLNTAKTDADPTARTSTTHDAWGRRLSTTNDFGDLTTTTYVAPGTPGAGSVATVVDAKGTTTYTYDGTDAAGNAERRGLVTAQTVTRPGPGGALKFTAAYDADGKMVTQKLPGQVTQTTSYDDAGEPESLTYSGTVQPVKLRTEPDPDTGEQVPVTDEAGNPVYDPDGPALQNQPWLAWSVTNDAQGRVKSELTGAAAGFDGNPGVNDPADITGYDVGKAIGYDRSYSYDSAGRLTQVVDHTAQEHGAALDGSPCLVRAYQFDNNGRRTGLTETNHLDGDCAGTNTTLTADVTYGYDSADRPTTARAGTVRGTTLPTGTYTYDPLGRQTSMPAADTPAYTPGSSVGSITLGYFDDDLPQSVSQDGTTTTFTLDSAARRQDAVTQYNDGSTSTLVRHYTDSSDNPAWVDRDGSVTRYNESIGGDLGVSITEDGSASLTVANLHGDAVTTIDVAADQATDTACLGITGWADYTEYGGVRGTADDGSGTTVPAASPAVAGVLGYGWLGAKQRSTTTETAGLTLMGDRFYNAVTGLFSSMDPEPGGNANAYTYPSDPINMFDLDGHFGWRKFWKRTATVTGLVAAGACIVATAGLCAGAAVLAAGASVGWAAYRKTRGTAAERRRSTWSYGREVALDVGSVFFRPARSAKYIKYAGRHRGVTRYLSRYAGRHRASRVATRSYGWHVRNRPKHTGFWTGVNLGMGWRSYRNGW